MPIDKHKIQQWKLERNISKLTKALTNDTFSVRMEAIKALQDLNSLESVPQLKLRLKDDVQVVAKAALEALMTLNPSEELVAELNALKTKWEEDAQKLEDHRAYWKKQNEIENLKRHQELAENMQFKDVLLEANDLKRKNRKTTFQVLIILGLIGVLGGTILKLLGVY